VAVYTHCCHAQPLRQLGFLVLITVTAAAAAAAAAAADDDDDDDDDVIDRSVNVNLRAVFAVSQVSRYISPAVSFGRWVF